jgi:hypothetical protein
MLAPQYCFGCNEYLQNGVFLSFFCLGVLWENKYAQLHSNRVGRKGLDYIPVFIPDLYA